MHSDKISNDKKNCHHFTNYWHRSSCDQTARDFEDILFFPSHAYKDKKPGIRPYESTFPSLQQS